MLPAVWIVLIYVILALLWFFLGDALPVGPPGDARSPLSLREGLFVAATAVVLYGLLQGFVRAQARTTAVLRDNQERIRAVVDNVLDGIVTIDERGIVQAFNPAAEKIFDCEASEIIGHSVGLLMPAPYQSEHDTYISNYLRTGEARIIGIGREVVGLRKDGTVFPMDLAVSEFQVNGKRMFTGIVRDITERKRVEEALRKEHAFISAVVDTAGSLVVVLDREGRIIRFNRACEQVTGYSFEEVRGRHIWEVLLVPEEVEPVLKVFEELGAGYFPNQYENHWVAKDGSRRLIAWSNTALVDDRGEVEYVVGTGIDVSERTRLLEQVRRHAGELEQRVAERTVELRETNAELESFAYSVSHDLRGPLRAVHRFSESLVENYNVLLERADLEQARQIAAAARRMDDMIRDLLAYSRISRAELELEPVALASVVADALLQLELEIKEREAVIVVKEPLPKVIGHHATLVQVLINLLTNAIKFVDSGVRPEVRISAQEDRERARLWIEDHGIGIAPENQERIFHIFERLHGVDEYSGTGIGLAVVRKGISRLGGQVGVESAPGRGSRFWLALPRVHT